MLKSSGIGTYLQNLIPRVIDKLKDVDFYLLGPSKYHHDPVFAQKSVQWIEADFPIFSPKEQLGLVRAIPADTDLYWAPHFNIPLFYHGKMLMTIHDVYPLADPQTVGRIRQFYIGLLVRTGHRRSSAVICDSAFTENELIRLAGADPSKIQVIHLGVAPEWFQITAQKRIYDNPYILYVGNVKPHKNLSMLLKAFQKAAEEIPHDLVLVGKKEGFRSGDPGVLRQAANLGERVRFTGYVDDDSLKQYFIHADALVFPSLYEGFGLPPLEAMASGIPTAVSCAASIPEVCGDAALYFDPHSVDDMAEKLIAVVDDPSLRQRLIERGRVRAAQFSWETCAEKTSGLIRSILR